MSTPSSTPADIQQLLQEMEVRCDPKTQTGNEDLFLEVEGPKLLSYIRTLEKDHRKMREAFEVLSIRPPPPERLRDVPIPLKVNQFAEAILTSLALNP